MIRFALFTFIVCIISQNTWGQNNYSWNEKELKLDNGYLIRSISYNKEKGSFSTSQFYEITDTLNRIVKGSLEFSFRANDVYFDGTQGWDFIDCKPYQDGFKGTGAQIRFKSRSSKPSLEVTITYCTYPQLSYVRKFISIKNLSKDEIKIEDLTIEALNTIFGATESWVYTNYAREKQLNTYIGDWDDPLLVVHDPDRKRGILVGNEAPGVLKRSAYNTGHNNIEAGLTNHSQDFPFRKWIKNGESWTSSKVFTGTYHNAVNPQVELNTKYQDFTRRHLGFRINTIKEKPVFVYNTWYPFRTFVNDTLMRSVAKAASECGIQEFVIDDGWQVNVGAKSSDKEWGGNYGDWKVDGNKFPKGLKSTFDYIKSLGMKPGLWISIGSATENAKVYKEHPEWFVKNYKNQPGNLHFVADKSDFYSSCMGTDWDDYIRDVIVGLSKDYGLAYAKLDLSVVASAYVNDTKVSGCYAKDHPYHKDHHESLWVLYDRLLKLFDEIHEQAPDLFIDCTFETAGKLQLMDYAIAQHAEGNWLSNFEDKQPSGQLRVRQMAWWRGQAIPASSLVIGNQQFDNEDFDFVLKSLIGSLPIVLGDPRKVPVEKRKEIKKWSLFLQDMQKKYDYMAFRQDLPGFGEPAEGSWDGWSRINTETKNGGIVGVFKHNAKEKSRTVVVTGLDPNANYKIYLAPDRKYVTSLKGSQIEEEGFKVELLKVYEGAIFEIAKE